MIGSSNSSFVVQPYQAYLIFIAISTFAVFLNIFGYRILGVWNEGARKFCDATSVLIADSPSVLVDYKLRGYQYHHSSNFRIYHRRLCLQRLFELGRVA